MISIKAYIQNLEKVCLTRERVKQLDGELVRGALLAKGPDSSLGEVHRGSYSEDIHMEEEKVEFKVQEDEVEDGRDKGRVRSEGRIENKQSLRRMTHG